MSLRTRTSIYILLCSFLFTNRAHAAPLCISLFLKEPSIQIRGSISEKIIAAGRTDGYAGTPIGAYSGFAQLKARLVDLKIGESAVLGSSGKKVKYMIH